jgi:hypothetical protein
VKTGRSKVLKFHNRSLILISFLHFVLVTLNSGCEHIFLSKYKNSRRCEYGENARCCTGKCQTWTAFRKIKNEGGLIQSQMTLSVLLRTSSIQVLFGIPLVHFYNQWFGRFGRTTWVFRRVDASTGIVGLLQ